MMTKRRSDTERTDVPHDPRDDRDAPRPWPQSTADPATPQPRDPHLVDGDLIDA
jgi:hypothetical protein